MDVLSLTFTGAADDATGLHAAAAQSLELMVPLRLLGATAGMLVTFVVLVSRVVDSRRVDIQRAPASRPISTPVPSLDLASLNWRA